MRVFNLAEELEKERKKNKELEERIKELKKYEKAYINESGLTHILVYRIDKAIEYIWSTKYEWGDLEEDNEDFDIDVYKLLDILKGDNK